MLIYGYNVQIRGSSVSLADEYHLEISMNFN